MSRDDSTGPEQRPPGILPARARAFALLLVIAGIGMLALAVSAVASGELGVRSTNVRVVVLVDALVKVVFGAGFLFLARFAVRRSDGAASGAGVLGGLGIAYLSAGLALRIPGVSLQVTLPGNNVLDSSGLDSALRSVREWWHEPVEIGLAVVCLSALLVAVGSLLWAFVRRAPVPDDAYRTRVIPQPDTEPVTALEPPEAAVDPWSSSRTEHSSSA